MRQQSAYGSYKRSGSRSTKSYANSVSATAQKKRKRHLNSTLKLVLICLILPPLGIYLLWSRDEGTLPLRIGTTIAACAVMFIWFMALIPGSTPATYEFTKNSPAPVTRYATAQSE